MNKIINIPLVLLAIFLIFELSACTEEKPKVTPSKKLNIDLDPILKEVNGLVAMMDINNRLNKVIYCAMASSLSKIQTEDGNTPNQLSENLLLKDIVTKQEGLCKLFQLAEKEANFTFDEIRKRKKVLIQQFIFSIFLSILSNDSRFNISAFSSITLSNSC